MQPTEPLFRAKAVESVNKRLEGQVVLIQPVSMTVMMYLLLLIIFAFLAYAASFSFSSYERVQGVLKYDAGELKVYPEGNAVIQKLYVANGDTVDVGAPLATLRVNEKAMSGRSDKELQQVEFEQQIATLEKNKTLAVEKSATETAKLELNIAVTRDRIKAAKQQYQIVLAQQKIDQAVVDARQRMAKSGFVSTLDVDLAVDTLLKTRERFQLLASDIKEYEGNLARYQADLAAQPAALKQQLGLLDNDISALRRQLIQLSNQIEYTLYARQSGVVGNIVALEGELVQVKFPLLSILPKNSHLVAELYIPSRARGFIQPGQHVYLRFDSFPSEYYGDMAGVVAEVSDSLLFPDDWPNPLKVNMPVYKLQVRPDRQFMHVEGEQVRLQQGLIVDADIILERRSMLDHLLSPLLKVKNSIH